jgi:hypothetical protein
VRGDGTVPRPSGRPIETPELEKLHRMVYVSEVHASLQNSPAMLDHVGGLLEESPIDPFRLPGGLPSPAPPLQLSADVAVIVDDLYGTSEPIVVGAQCDAARALHATIINATTDEVVSDVPIVTTEPDVRADSAPLGPLPEGTYRVMVHGGANVRSATDVFLVANDKA